MKHQKPISVALPADDGYVHLGPYLPVRMMSRHVMVVSLRRYVFELVRRPAIEPRRHLEIAVQSNRTSSSLLHARHESQPIHRRSHPCQTTRFSPENEARGLNRVHDRRRSSLRVALVCDLHDPGFRIMVRCRTLQPSLVDLLILARRVIRFSVQ